MSTFSQSLLLELIQQLQERCSCFLERLLLRYDKRLSAVLKQPLQLMKEMSASRTCTPSMHSGRTCPSERTLNNGMPLPRHTSPYDNVD